MRWPLNYPGDSYITNVFGQVIILLDDIKESTVEFVEEMVEVLKDDSNE